MISDRIELNPTVLAGKPIIKGTRIGVEQIIDHLASGWSNRDILDNYPKLTQDDIVACLTYVSTLIHEERFYPLKAI